MKRKTTASSIIKYFFILLFAISINGAYAQYENTSGQKKEGEVKKRPKPKKSMRFFAGGMFGAGFSSYSSYVEVAPIFGVKITPDFHVGIRITYIWNSYEFQGGQRENLHHYGASLFARYVFFKGLFGQVEYEALSFDYYNYPREWITSLFIGGGYYQNIGGRGYASFAILFNLLDNIDSPYANPIIRIGFGGSF